MFLRNWCLSLLGIRLCTKLRLGFEEKMLKFDKKYLNSSMNSTIQTKNPVNKIRFIFRVRFMLDVNREGGVRAKSFYSQDTINKSSGVVLVEIELVDGSRGRFLDVRNVRVEEGAVVSVTGGVGRQPMGVVSPRPRAGGGYSKINKIESSK
uniref:Uncharacterized protein n=1 Tax=Cacopsylla melanoneura TaxID=428564 RepID=A0A8D9A702_9HEMI